MLGDIASGAHASVKQPAGNHGTRIRPEAVAIGDFNRLAA